MPLVSIVVPVYNVEKYLQRCLDSIKNQSFSNFECILINDGSTDKSGKICDDYCKKDSRFKVIHKQNAGVSAARNDGIEASSGDWICFVDSDDWISINHIENFLEHTDKDLIFCSDTEFFDDGYSITYNLTDMNDSKLTDSINTLIFRDPQRDFFGYTWNKLFKTQIIKENNLRFRNDLYFKEDELFTFEYCFHANSIGSVNYPTYNYFINKNGLTFKHKDFQQYKLYVECLLELYNKNNETELNQVLLKHAINVLSWSLLSAKMNPSNIKFLKKVKTLYIKNDIQLDSKIAKIFRKLPIWLFLQGGIFYRFLKRILH